MAVQMPPAVLHLHAVPCQCWAGAAAAAAEMLYQSLPRHLHRRRHNSAASSQHNSRRPGQLVSGADMVPLERGVAVPRTHAARCLQASFRLAEAIAAEAIPVYVWETAKMLPYQVQLKRLESLHDPFEKSAFLL